ncbi:hypothetical protein [Mesorhizobium comanense]|uniref:hypothetical protein n=1 Tax=Mesorhizobium comanense TaxID=2502215 RepID=UPI0010F547ED|nr:hypothetical protein [Mesorhizobium comanense]
MQSRTFDEVADQTGVGKGGRLHHVSNKDALTRTMAEEFVEQFESDLSGPAREDHYGGGRYTRAVVSRLMERTKQPGSAPRNDA